MADDAFPRAALAAVLLLMAALSGPVGAHAPERAPEQAPERAVVRLSCVAAPEVLCQALLQALSEAAGGMPVMRLVAPGTEAPARPQDLGIALAKGAAGASWITGRLDWQQGSGAVRRGPELRFDQMDATVTPQSHASFARDLIRATPDLAAALRGPTDRTDPED